MSAVDAHHVSVDVVFSLIPGPARDGIICERRDHPICRQRNRSLRPREAMTKLQGIASVAHSRAGRGCRRRRRSGSGSCTSPPSHSTSTPRSGSLRPQEKSPRSAERRSPNLWPNSCGLPPIADWMRPIGTGSRPCSHDHCWHSLEECNPDASNNRGGLRSSWYWFIGICTKQAALAPPSRIASGVVECSIAATCPQTITAGTFGTFWKMQPGFQQYS